MLKMIIADDEILVREGLKNIIDWSKYNIEIVAYAKNGSEALSLCEDYEPDILFTDIRMPHLSGIEVVQRLKELGLKMRFIILSGYDDFTYAQKSVELKVENYILKPVKREKVIEVIEKVIASITMEKEHAVKFSQLKNQLNEHIPALRDRFLINLIFKNYTDEKLIYDKCRFLKINFTSDIPYIVCKMVVNEVTGHLSNDFEENYELVLMSILNICNELLNHYSSSYAFNLNDKEFVIVLNSKDRKHILKMCDDLLDSLNRYINVKVSIGIGSEVATILNLYSSYKSAEVALDHQFYSGLNAIIDSSDLYTKSLSIEYGAMQLLEENLLSVIKIGNITMTKEVLNQLFSYIEQSTDAYKDYTKAIFIELISTISRSLYEIQENLADILDDTISISNKISHFDTYEELKVYITEVLMTIVAYFYEKLNQNNTFITNQIMKIIKTQYTYKITVQDIAEQVALTPNYISQIFKKETGNTITKTITDVRIEAAKQLLKDSNFKVFEVAEMVGFDNSYYFSTVFKKVTGLHPSKYR